MPGRLYVGLALLPIVLASAPAAAADPPPKADGAAVEFFEKEVRPLLATRCQGCHGPEKQKGGLRLDSRTSVLSGGDSGPAVVPGRPADSLLVEAINYGDQVQMPPKSKLPPAEVATLTRWVATGAPWPIEERKSSTGSAAPGRPWKERESHWSFRPVHRFDPPDVKDTTWAHAPIDRFLLAGLEAKGLKPAPDADRRTWIRRVTFDLIGLPPRPEEVEAFVADGSKDAFEKVVDRLLASPRYGERWARHWLDLVRYAETSGHEFDYEIPDAWRYRDYVIRAFNSDVPYDQFVVEHVAGDLLHAPRRHPSDGTNESILATGFYFMGEGTHSPVDLREEEAGRIDGQIDTLGKAFLGLTLACARCHDHKFDAIRTKDYYGLSGFLKSSRLQHAFLDPPGRDSGAIAELSSIRRELARRLGEPRVAGVSSARPRSGVDSPAVSPTRPQPPDTSETKLSTDQDGVLFDDFSKPGYEGWFASGEAFGPGPSRSGEWKVHTADKKATLVPAGWAHSGLVSDRLEGVLRSRTFTTEQRFVHVRAMGNGGRINLVLDGFEKIRDPIYGGLTKTVRNDEPRWITFDLEMWRGHRAYVELADGAIVDFTTGLAHRTNGDGYLAVDEIRFSDRAAPPADKDDRTAAIALDDPALKPLLDRYREAEARIAPPMLGLAVADGSGEDDHVHIRGSTRNLGEVAPRRFLEVFGGSSSPGSGSGRLELARRIADPANPLTARVIVNRIWKHHFGEGLVRSTDDFGAMGAEPSHPDLLDWLASEFVRDGWSIKRMHRRMVLSRAYRMASIADPESERADPTNKLLHRMNVRRLEAEALRDAMLALSGRLDTTMYGPSVPTHLTAFMEGRGRPSRNGPLDGAGRRTIYLEVRRNFPAPMLLAFDFPTLPACMGRRNVSNVPAQALTLLNDPFVLDQAKAWAGRVRKEEESPEKRLDALYLAGFGRAPDPRERAQSLAFVGSKSHAPGDEAAAWVDLCHVLLNTKDFLFIP
ncbi:MAG TPA: PSD1 and planctomycete cytochrome C domain-containing protein [Isosphaeraceae bacterium]